MEVIAPDRGRSRGGTRGGKPNVAAPDAGLGGGMGGPIAPRLDGEIERCDGTELATMNLLGPLITRPKLSEKLLSKPPFRFLFDIVMEVIRATGFASGLYSPEESDSANVSEKEQKIVFLEKIIKVVGLQLNTLVVANPGKIIAGKDPQDTNNFLQLLAVAAKNLPDSSAAVRTVLGDAGGPMSAPAPSVAAASKPAPQPQREREVEKEIEERPAPKVRFAPHALPPARTSAARVNDCRLNPSL
jgi:TRAF3-interacting protein 1